MGRRGGFPGGGMPGNMNNLMKQAQRMQRQMEESQKELETKEFTAKAGGGAVEATVFGNKTLKSVVISPDAVVCAQMIVCEKILCFGYIAGEMQIKCIDCQQSINSNLNLTSSSLIIICSRYLNGYDSLTS